MKRNSIIIAIIIIFLLTYILLINQKLCAFNHLIEQRFDHTIVVIDAGHGGFDPGKVGINNTIEKDINLSVAMKLKNLLEFHDIKVIMTRDEDIDFASSSRIIKAMKKEDLSKRVKIINSSDAIIAISIHQNSFTQNSARGSQVFYYVNSEKGRILAENIQDCLKQTMNDNNHRLAKSNSTYYLLKNSKPPLVIVECGFLSNRAEAELLCNGEYQDKIAWAIQLGVIEYLEDYYSKDRERLVNK